jgi:hypothetical protein
MKSKALVVLLMTVIFLTLPVLAQGEENRFASLRAQFWPEYDRPEMLVLYDITLPLTTRLPATITVMIPASAGEPSAVASRQPDNSLINLNYDPPVKKGQWLEITFDATTLESRVEYYDPGLVKDGSLRSFTYLWPGGTIVDEFQVIVQQPIGASDMKLTPEMGNGIVGTDGMTYYHLDAGSLKILDNFQFEMEYTKETDALSSDSLEVVPAQPIDSSPSIDNTLSPLLPWLLFGLGLALIIGAGVWYWRSGGTSKSGRKLATSHHRRKPSGQREDSTAVSSGDEAVYCHQCGKRAMKGDRFCRVCGTQLRIT